MSAARVKCDAVWTAVPTGRAAAWTDPAGNVYVVSGSGSEADNAALNQCARANLGPGLPPVHWLTLLAIAALLLGLAAVPLIRNPRAAGAPKSLPDSTTLPKAAPPEVPVAGAHVHPGGEMVPTPADQPLAHDFGMPMAANHCVHCGASLAPGLWYCSYCREPRGHASPDRPAQALPRLATTDAAPGERSDETDSLWVRFRRQPAWVQVVAWLFGGGLMIIFFIWSGTDLPWYGKLALGVGLLAPITAFSYALG